MTLALPFPLGGSASGWRLTDFITPVLASPPAPATGVARIEFPTLDTDVQWLVDRAVVSCTSVVDTALRFYDSSVAVNQLLSGSASGNFDEADYPAGLLVRPGGSLLAVWTGATTGAVGTCRLQVRVMRRS